MDLPTGRIHREISQGKPFRSQTVAAVLSLVRTVDALKGFVGTLVRTHGITLQQYNILRILQGAGDVGFPTLEIRERMVERNPGITGLLDRLENKGLVTRARGTEDRRRVHCIITAEGTSILASLAGPIAAAEDAAMHELGPDELTQLIRVLDRIRMNIASESPA